MKHIAARPDRSSQIAILVVEVTAFRIGGLVLSLEMGLLALPQRSENPGAVLEVSGNQDGYARIAACSAAGEDLMAVLDHLRGTLPASKLMQTPAGSVTLAAVDGDYAWSLLKHPGFRKSWDELLNHCPWATVFQGRTFAAAWYEAYRDLYDPVLVVQLSSIGEIQGLLALARSHGNDQLCHAGGHQAEYQVWLALPRVGNSFIAEGLRLLRRCFPGVDLIFKYLPPGAPLAWAHKDWRDHCIVEDRQRPVIKVKDPPSAAEYVREKLKGRNKTYLNRLKRMGDLLFERLEDPARVESNLNEIFLNYDLRQGAAHGSFPFREDPQKRSFHVSLVRAGIAHVTVLRLDGQIVASHFGLHDATTLYWCIPSFSPLHGRTHASTLHMLMLIEQLPGQGLSILDLTPGGEYKERFATDYETVHVISVFARRVDCIRKTARSCGIRWIKSILQRSGLLPPVLRMRLMANKMGRRKITSLPVLLLRAAARTSRDWIWRTDQLRVYMFRTELPPAAEMHRPMSLDCLSDLLAYEAAEGWQDRQAFLREALSRLERGDHHVYTLVEEGRLVHYGWLIEHQSKAFYSEVQQEFELPPGSAVLFDFYTHPLARGRGHYQRALRQLLQDATEIPGVSQVCITVRADNRPSRHAIEKLGFICFATLGTKRRFGTVTRTATTKP